MLLTAVLTFKECSSVATLLDSTAASQFAHWIINFSYNFENKLESLKPVPEGIYNSHYDNVYLLVLSSQKVNIAENPIAKTGL